MNSGIPFEKVVAETYKALGKRRVKHNVLLFHKTKDGLVKNQFDVVFGLLRKYYVECKYKTDGVVTFNEVAVFAGKLELAGVPYKRGIVVTNTDYDLRAREYARKIGLSLVNGADFESLRLKAVPFFKRLYRKPAPLEELIAKYANG